jgi:hypothetical protein
LQKHIVNDYATSTTGDGDKRAIKSCCDYDASKTPFDRLFGANVSKFSRTFCRTEQNNSFYFRNFKLS